ncbi:MAG: hypothetical protein ACKVI6_05070 [Candidatus Poseidoniales archaeon]|jgi:hypothetical protein|tara:strand:- start:2283 stop:2678 length:396 start_codon:yes stop_codon:yes gene_type:complete
MKWDDAPLGIIILPVIIGFLIACISGYYDPESLRIPLLVLIVMSFLLYPLPLEIDNKWELVGGSIIAIIIGILPQLIFFVWFIIVLIIWFSQTLYIWKYNIPSFRIGIWIGLGGCCGTYIGSFFSYFFLIN